MIGSHDTFTYLEPVNPVYKLFKRWWKCQCKTIDEQYDAGVRFFDIRVAWYKNEWHVAHGLITFDLSFATIYDICLFMKEHCPDAIYRIVLERGNKTIEALFVAQIPDNALNEFPLLWRMDIKSMKEWKGLFYNNDIALYKKGYKFANVNTWEPPAHELHGTVTKSNLCSINLKEEAKKINSNIDFFKDSNKLKQMTDSKDELYFLDYCTNEC